MRVAWELAKPVLIGFAMGLVVLFVVSFFI